MLHRRDVLRGVAALAAAPLLSLTAGPAWAAVPPRRGGQVPGWFRLDVGDVEVTALYDGAGLARTDMLHGAPPETIAARLADAGLDPAQGEPIAINAFLLNTGRNLVLVDTGGGAAMGPRAGRLPENLAAAGYAPDQVDTVLLTHLHPDHAMGLAGSDGRALFPNAVVRPSAAEAGYWLGDAVLAAAPENRRAAIQALRAVLDRYAGQGRFRPFAPGEAPAPGLEAVPLPGHTPGHTGFRAPAPGRALTCIGDLLHSAAVQFPLPAVSIDYDTDQAAAVATRLPALARLAEEGGWVAGAHLPFPGLGRLRARDAGYVWLPAPYAPGPRG